MPHSARNTYNLGVQLLAQEKKKKAKAVPSPQAKAIAARIALLRNRVGLTQKEVAHAIGVSEKAYQNYEYATRQPRIVDVPTLANALQCEPGDFFREPTSRVAIGRIARQPDDSPAPPHLFPMRDALRDMGIPEDETVALLTITDALARRNGA